MATFSFSVHAKRRDPGEPVEYAMGIEVDGDRRGLVHLSREVAIAFLTGLGVAPAPILDGADRELAKTSR